MQLHLKPNKVSFHLTFPSRINDAKIREILARFKEFWPKWCFSIIEAGGLLSAGSSNNKKLSISLRRRRHNSTS